LHKVLKVRKVNQFYLTNYPESFTAVYRILTAKITSAAKPYDKLLNAFKNLAFYKLLTGI
jgi:hypothetical protein